MFVDTNVLIYALTQGPDPRHGMAHNILQQLLAEERACLSTQVLQETFVTLVRKVAVSIESALTDLDDLAQWPVFQVDVAAIQEAGKLVETARISFWDALMVVAASRMRAPLLYTEDLNHGQIIAGVRVVNPFL